MIFVIEKDILIPLMGAEVKYLWQSRVSDHTLQSRQEPTLRSTNSMSARADPPKCSMKLLRKATVAQSRLTWRRRGVLTSHRSLPCTRAIKLVPPGCPASSKNG